MWDFTVNEVSTKDIVPLNMLPMAFDSKLCCDTKQDFVFAQHKILVQSTKQCDP